MNKEDRYTTVDLYRVGINLTPMHYNYLREIANRFYNQSISDAIQYLLTKYLIFLYEIRITPYKRTETATYQPTTKQYKRYSIKINPTLWSKLFDSRRFLGYSISAILRILLDWEMQSLGRDILPLIPLPQIESTDELSGNNQNQMIQSYVYIKSTDYETRSIFCIFSDQFY